MKVIYITRNVTFKLEDEDGNVVATLRKPETFAIAVDKASSSLRFLKGDGSFGATLCDLNAAEIKTLS
jgi:hypothetical protein